MSLLRGLETIEVHNFKSYRGTTIIGPFREFTAIVGPNGSGKSNVIDALIFGLGITSNKIRADRLKDLINNVTVINEQQPTAYVELKFIHSPERTITARRTIILHKHQSKTNPNEIKYHVRSIWSIDGKVLDRNDYLSELALLGLGFSHPDYIYAGNSDYTNDITLATSVSSLIEHINTYNEQVAKIQTDQSNSKMNAVQQNQQQNKKGHKSDQQDSNNNNTDTNLIPNLSLTMIEELILNNTLDPINKHDLPPFILPQAHVALFSHMTSNELFQVINSASGNSILSHILSQLSSFRAQSDADIARFRALQDRYTKDQLFLQGQQEDYDNYLQKQATYFDLLSEYFLFSLFILDLQLFQSIESMQHIEQQQQNKTLELTQIQQNMSQLDLQVIECRKELNNIRRKLQQLEHTLTTPQETIQKLHDTIKKLETKKIGHDLDITNMKNRLDMEKDALDNLQGQLQRVENEYEIILEEQQNAQNNFSSSDENDNNNNNNNNKKGSKQQSKIKPTVDKLSNDIMNEYSQLKAIFEHKWNVYCLEQSATTTIESKSTTKKSNSKQKVTITTPINQLYATQTSLDQSILSLTNMIAQIEQSKSDLNRREKQITTKIQFAENSKNESEQLIIEKQQQLKQIQLDINNYDFNRNKKQANFTIINTKLKMAQQYRSNIQYNSKYIDIVKELQSFFSPSLVHGLVQELVTSKVDHYSNALGAALGRYNNAIVVNTTETAMKCVAYLQEQKLAPCMFLSIQFIKDQLANTSSAHSGTNNDQKLTLTQKVTKIKRFLGALHSDVGLTIQPNGGHIINHVEGGLGDIDDDNDDEQDDKNDKKLNKNDNDNDDLGSKGTKQSKEKNKRKKVTMGDDDDNNNDDDNDDDLFDSTDDDTQQDITTNIKQSTTNTTTSSRSIVPQNTKKVKNAITIKSKTARRLLDFVQYEKIYQPIMTYLLSHVIVDDSIEKLTTYAFNDNFIGIKYVSTLGDIIHTSKYITYSDSTSNQQQSKTKNKNKNTNHKNGSRTSSMGDDDDDDDDNNEDIDGDNDDDVDINQRTSKMKKLAKGDKISNFDYTTYEQHLITLQSGPLTQHIQQLQSELNNLKIDMEKEYGVISMNFTNNNMAIGHKNEYIDKKRDLYTHIHFELIHEQGILKGHVHEIDLYTTQLTTIKTEQKQYEKQIQTITTQLDEKNNELQQIAEELQQYQEIKDDMEKDIFNELFTKIGSVQVPIDFFNASQSNLRQADNTATTTTMTTTSKSTKNTKGKKTTTTMGDNDDNSDNSGNQQQQQQQGSNGMISVTINSVSMFERFVIQIEKLYQDKILAAKTLISTTKSQIAYIETEITNITKQLIEKEKKRKSIDSEIDSINKMEKEILQKVQNLHIEQKRLQTTLEDREDEYKTILLPQQDKLIRQKEDIQRQVTQIEKELRLHINELLSWQRQRNEISQQASMQNVVLPKLSLNNIPDIVNPCISSNNTKSRFSLDLSDDEDEDDDNNDNDDDNNEQDNKRGRSSGKKTPTKGTNESKTVKKGKVAKSTTTTIGENDDNNDTNSLELMDYLFLPLSTIKLIINDMNQHNQLLQSPQQNNKKSSNQYVSDEDSPLQMLTRPLRKSNSKSQQSQSQQSPSSQQLRSQLNNNNDNNNDEDLPSPSQYSPCVHLPGLIATSPTASSVLPTTSSATQFILYDYSQLPHDLRDAAFITMIKSKPTISMPITKRTTRQQQDDSDDDNDGIHTTQFLDYFFMREELLLQYRSQQAQRMGILSLPSTTAIGQSFGKGLKKQGKIQTLTKTELTTLQQKITALGLPPQRNHKLSQRQTKLLVQQYEASIADHKKQVEQLALSTAFASLSGGNITVPDDDGDDDNNDNNNKKKKGNKNDTKLTTQSQSRPTDLFQILIRGLVAAQRCSQRFSTVLSQLQTTLEQEMVTRFLKTFSIVKNTAQRAYKQMTNASCQLEMIPMNITSQSSILDGFNDNIFNFDEPKYNTVNTNQDQLLFDSVSSSNSVNLGGGYGLTNNTLSSSLSPPQIILQARPPQKQLTNAAMLSGGEKGLVSVCVLLGMLQAIGCGVAVLDEVDANLDPFMVTKLSHFLQQQVHQFVQKQKQLHNNDGDDDNNNNDIDDKNKKKDGKDKKKLKLALDISQSQQTQDSFMDNDNDDDDPTSALFARVQKQQEELTKQDEKSKSILGLYQCICISLKNDMYSNADALIGVSSHNMMTQIYSLDLSIFGDV